MKFRTHTGEIVTGERLEKACHSVACWMEKNAQSVFDSDPYASHVTKEQKLKILHDNFDAAQNVKELKNLNNFTIWQRVNAELTGECVALFNNKKG